MKWTIIVLIMMSLVGSMMWMMPSPRQKMQAKLRLRARNLGLQVQLVRLTAPRAEGEMEGETTTVPAYRMMRTNIDRKQADMHVGWQIHRVRAVACDGLPEGWSWAWGEGDLNDQQLSVIAEAIECLPEDVIALESSPVQLSAFWQEDSGEQNLDGIKSVLETLHKAYV